MNKTYNWDIIYANTIKTTPNIEDIILNEKNRQITKDYLKKTFTKYGINYVINDIRLFEICVTHTSYLNLDYSDIKNFKTIFKGLTITDDIKINPIEEEIKQKVIQLKTESYERLEFYGDALMRSILSEYLICRFPEMNPGELSHLRSQIENNRSFSSFCKIIGLNKYILISRINEILGARDKDINLQCDVFEAFICALYFDVSNIKYDDIGYTIGIIHKDRGEAYQKCYEFVVNLIENENEGLDICSILEVNTNYKSRLINVYHSFGWKDPVYPLLNTIQNENKQTYLVGLYDNKKNIIAEFESSSKQSAEKMCALIALNNFGKLDMDN